jgi:hypothetical protein
MRNFVVNKTMFHKIFKNLLENLFRDNENYYH